MVHMRSYQPCKQIYKHTFKFISSIIFIVHRHQGYCNKRVIILQIQRSGRPQFDPSKTTTKVTSSFLLTFPASAYRITSDPVLKCLEELLDGLKLKLMKLTSLLQSVFVL